MRVLSLSGTMSERDPRPCRSRRSNSGSELTVSWAGGHLHGLEGGVRHSRLNGQAEDSGCVGWKGTVSVGSRVQRWWSALSAAAARPNADGGASVKPALTLWQLSGAQSGRARWDAAFPTQSRGNCLTVTHYEYFILLHRSASKVWDIPFPLLSSLLSWFLAQIVSP